MMTVVNEDQGGNLDGDLGDQVEGVWVKPGQVNGIPFHQKLAQHCPLKYQ